MDNNPLGIAKEAVELEKQFRANECRGKINNPCPLVIRGTLPVVLSAPHAVVHYRSGKEKLNEPYTGALALQLHKHIGTSVIIYTRTTWEDPNWDTSGPYKENLKELVREASVPFYFLLDLHGMSAGISRDVIIGTANGKSLLDWPYLLDSLKWTLINRGLTNIAVDQWFSAANPQTITSYTYRELRVPALQLEIGAKFRNPVVAPEQYARLFSALSYMIVTVLPLDVTGYPEEFRGGSKK